MILDRRFCYKNIAMVTDEEKKELIVQVEQITEPFEQRAKVYSILEKLVSPYKKTTCKKCVKDYLNIIREELGIIDNAADESDFNAVEESKAENGYVYLKLKPVAWNGHILDQNTPVGIIELFLGTGAKGYYNKR